MKRKLIALPFLFFALLFANSCGEEKVQSKNMEQLYNEEGVPVKIKEITKDSFSKELNYNTILTGIKESAASAMIGGRIEKVLVNVGDYVNKDQVIFTFPSDAPSAQFDQAKVAYENSKNMYERYQKLFDVGGISAQDLDNVKTQYEVNKANFETASKMVKVLAPISGFVTKVNVRESDDVKKETLLATIADLSQLKGSIQISESDISDVIKGTKAIAEWQGIAVEGKVTQVDLAMNPMTQAFNADVVFDNKNQKLKAGVTADITLVGTNLNEVVILERKDIVFNGSQPFIFAVNNGVAKKKQVKIGKNNGLTVEILEGIELGDQIVTEGIINLEDNSKVKIIK